MLLISGFDLKSILTLKYFAIIFSRVYSFNYFMIEILII